MNRRTLLLLLLPALSPFLFAQEPLPGTPLLEPPASPEERSTPMVAGISKWLHRESERMTEDRHQRWEAAAKGEDWEKFAAEKRKELAAVLGFETQRARPVLQTLESFANWSRVRWSVFEGVWGEGFLWNPAYADEGTTIVVPDAYELPEHWLGNAINGHQRTLVPVLVSRETEFSGNEAIRLTNEPHREWIYRQAFEVGRTLVGFEVQKILAAVDALHDEKIGIVGSGEGGMIALRAAALDPRFRSVIVRNAFEPRTDYEWEPIDHNVFGFRRDFGDAELAALVSARVFAIGQDERELISPPPRLGRSQAAPAAVKLPSRQTVLTETDMANRFRASPATVLFFPDPELPSVRGIDISPEDARERQRRTVRELEQFTQNLIDKAERQRNADVWAKVGTPQWDTARAALKERLWASIGKLPGAALPPNPRTRRVLEAPKWTAYEVMLDVRPDVFAWGWLLVPKDLKPGERRPVVVCQHGLEGLPGDTVTEDPKEPGFKFYKGFAARLADEGYITYAPHNPYRGQNDFRQLQRQANPLGLSLFSFIIAQHEVTTDWLASLPFVDPARIGFYGLSYGGKTAMRVPALVDRYALSICSGDFNEWIRKTVSVDEPPGFMFTKEYEMFEWNLAWNASYAEMAMLIAPRPFMVERGHRDGVGTDEWVAYEFAKVRRGYLRLGIPERAAIEWFDGPHTINGVGTFDFLRKYLGPARR